MTADERLKIASIFGARLPDPRTRPLQAARDALPCVPGSGPYSRTMQIENALGNYGNTHEPDANEMLARLLLLELSSLRYWQPQSVVPTAIRDEVEHETRRIRSDVTDKPKGYYALGSDTLRKDLALLRGSALPVHAGIVDTYTAIRRKPLTVGSYSQRIRFFSMLCRRPIGTKYFLQSHLHKAMIHNFNEDGRRRMFELVCLLLENNADHKGFVGSSWFYDPAIPRISPHLNYLTQLPLDNGARRFFIGADDSGSALWKSDARRKLFEAGDYVPTLYMLVWHRKEMMWWHREWGAA